MSSRKEEERNEKIIRGLMKLPPNRRCINCDSLGPQYVCTNFWTFICTTCSGIHREFTHRVKSVSMAKFNAQEVEALQRGGNQRARELFLKDWDVQRTRLPDSSNAEKIREFIRNVYVDKKYAGGRPSDKPPRDTQSLKNHEDHRRASSYHSFSQSPPYEHQYEDRRYGKQSGMLSRKPGSDRGHSEGKISSFMFSPGRLGEQMHEDNFANESCGSRISDYSVSGRGDPFRSDGQSPNFQDTGLSCRPLHQVREIVIEDARPQTLNTHSEATDKRDFDGIPCSQRTASLGSFGSSDGSSAVNSGSLIDIVLEPEHAFPSSHSSASANSTKLDLFNLPTVQQPTTSLAPPIDLFAGINHQASFTTPSEQETFSVSVPENVGWATFDLPHHAGPASETNYELPSMVLPGDEAPKRNIDASSSMHNNSQWFPVQNSAAPEPFPLMADQWHVGMHEVKGSADPTNFQSWNAFDDSTGNVSQSSLWTLPQNSETKALMHKPSTSDDPYTSLKVSEEETILKQKSTNPFDLLYDSDPELNDVFLGMSSLQEALPNPQLPWFSQNSIPTYIPSVHQGELAYIAGQVASSQLPNAPPQGPVASLGGGNPFA